MVFTYRLLEATTAESVGQSSIQVSKKTLNTYPLNIVDFRVDLSHLNAY